MSERPFASLAVTPARLERQLKALLAAGYVGTTFQRVVLSPPRERTMAVTFDDAYRSVFRLAWPVLRDLGIPGTVFAPTAFIGSEQPMSWPGIAHLATGPHAEELTPMSWPELGELADRGWEIGSHTRTHPRLTTLGDEAVREELEGSSRDCEERLGVPCRSLAYPHGDYDPQVVDAARDAGYVAAGALARQVQRPMPLAWPRVGVYQNDGNLRFKLKVSAPVARIRSSRIWRARRWLSRGSMDAGRSS